MHNNCIYFSWFVTWHLFFTAKIYCYVVIASIPLNSYLGFNLFVLAGLTPNQPQNETIKDNQRPCWANTCICTFCYAIEGTNTWFRCTDLKYRLVTNESLKKPDKTKQLYRTCCLWLLLLRAKQHIQLNF